MNIYLIGEYVKRLTKEDITKFAYKQGITLKDKELNIIFNTIKENYKTLIYGNARNILDDLKDKVEPLTYNKIITLYKEFKEKIS